MNNFENIFNIFIIVTPILLFIQLIIVFIISKYDFKFSKYLIGFFLAIIISVYCIISDVNNSFLRKNDEFDITLNNSYIISSDEIEGFLDTTPNNIDKNQETSLDLNKLQYSDNFTSYLTEVTESIEYSSKSPSLESDSIIATNIVSGESYSLEQLANEKLFIPYREDDKEILFYGSYNNSCLNGNCIYNIYKNNRLDMIIESKYENGNLISYSKVTNDTTTAGINTWSISYRENRSNYNSGITLNYFKNYDYTKNFNLTDATLGDILYVNDFEDELKNTSILEGYYNGNTSDGYYNDTTGNAYMIKFFDDSTVRMLYCGNFKNGYPDDNTGNAWDIVRNKNTNYMYYKGDFKNGSTTNSKGYIFENNLTVDSINEILNQNNFEVPFDLNWNSTLNE